MFERVDIVPDNEKGTKKAKKLLRNHSEKLRAESTERSSRSNHLDVLVYDNSDKEKTYKRRKLAPFETYEIWNQEDNINRSILHYEEDVAMRKGKVLEDSKDGKSEEFTSDEEEHGEKEDIIDEEEAKELDANGRTPHSCIRYQLALYGLEVLPHVSSETKPSDVKNKFEPALSTTLSYSRRHVLILTNLLHINVLRRNWKIAHRCFAMLIRINFVDIRSIWPIGLEILTRLAEEKFKETQPIGSVTGYKLKTYNTSEGDYLKIFKDEQFLNWLETFYQINLNSQPHRKHTPYPFRLTSRFNTPLFVLELIWIMIMKQKFDDVNEKLSELVLRKVYIDQGIFYFLQGFSNQLEASVLSKNPALDRQKIEELMLNAKKLYQRAKEKGAEFPEKLLNGEMNIIKARLAQDLDYHNSRVDDTHTANGSIYDNEIDDMNHFMNDDNFNDYEDHNNNENNNNNDGGDDDDDDD